MTDEITIRSDLRPGDLGRLIALHGTAYIDERGHFGIPFEAHVARTVAEFVLDNEAQGKIFFAERGATLVGCAAMVERRSDTETRGQLRWVLLDAAARGAGVGKRLVDLAIAHARDQGWSTVFLETTDGLAASMAIYEKLGFKIVDRKLQKLWTGDDDVIVMELALR
jgi:N-acetylglutamate synthase-like GNAT family acetyltransferase